MLCSCRGVEVLADGEVAAGVYLLRVRISEQGVATSERLAVLRYEPAWPRIVGCGAATAPHRAAVLDGLQEACAAIEVVAGAP